jgi:predicted transposase/invertase (TIGR01784 family)
MAKHKASGSSASGPKVFMNIKTDFGFKKVFGNKKVLMAFLNALKILPETITDIEYLPGEHPGFLQKNRKAIYDTHCRTESGKRFIIEMQIAEQLHFAERMLLYSSYPIIEQAPKGKVKKRNQQGKEFETAWDYSIDGVYTVAILDFILFREEKARDIVIEYVKLVRQKANLVFTDKYEFAIVELPKFTKGIEEVSGTLEKWLYSLKYIEKLSECPDSLHEEIFKELYEEAKLNKLTEQEMEAYKQSVLEYDDVILAVDYAEEKGEKRGIEIGEKRGEKRGIEIGTKRGIETGRKHLLKEIVHNSYRLNMSLKQIAELTGLTEEEISDMLTKGSQR